jgi:hypothetical protein
MSDNPKLDGDFRNPPAQNGGQVVIQGDPVRDPAGNPLPPGSLGHGVVMPVPAGFPGVPPPQPQRQG